MKRLTAEQAMEMRLTAGNRCWEKYQPRRCWAYEINWKPRCHQSGVECRAKVFIAQKKARSDETKIHTSTV